MKTVSLLGVFLVARGLVLAGHSLPVSPWTPIAYLWQDLLVVLCFAGFELATRRRPTLAWGLYALCVGYIALNVPIACVLSTPLTWPLLRATHGTLGDSILHYLTIANGLRLVLVLGSGVLLPLLCHRYRLVPSLPGSAVLIAGSVILIGLGPLATDQVETLGLHRNVFVLLVTTALPRIAALEATADWSVSPFGSPATEDLGGYRGAAAGRNVIVVHLESTPARYLQPYGAPEDPMPQLTRLAQRGLIFEHAYTAYPETIKSFFTVQCALYPALDTRAEDYEPIVCPSLASLLADAGYRTGLFHSGRFAYLGMESVLRGRGYQTREDAGTIGGEHSSSFGIGEPSTIQRMLEWIDALPQGQRFFLAYLPIAGHHPYETLGHGPFPEEAEIDHYRNALHAGDAALSELWHGLQERGLDQNTLFLFFGDHGEAFGQHEGNIGHTLFLYEENVHVPYVIIAPGLIREQIRIRRTASLIDTAPTILDLLRLPQPARFQGRSLLIGQDRLALFCTDYSLGFVGLRDGPWKMIHQLDSGRSQLFDLDADPNEKQNLASQLPERVTAYREHLLSWAAAQKHLVSKAR